MLKQRSRSYQFLQLSGDILITALCLPLAYLLRRQLPLWMPDSIAELFHPELRPLEHYLLLLALILPAWGIALYFHGAHRLLPTESGKEYLRGLINLEVTGAFILGFLSFILRLDLSRPILFLFLVLNLLLLCLYRLLVAWFIRRRSYRDFQLRRIVIIGTNETALRIADRIKKYCFYGIKLAGHLTFTGELPSGGAQPPEATPFPQANRKNTGGSRIPVLGSLDDLADLVRREVIDEVVFVAEPNRDWHRFHDAFRFCEELGLRIRLVADIFPNSISRISIDHLDGIPLITFASTPDHGLALALKRLVDVAVGSLALILSLPLLALSALLIKLTSPGPVLYRQIRCGLYGRRFTLYKFRSMVDGAEDILWEIRHLNEMSGPVFKMRNDPRVTPLGRFLRKASIDELPQLWNVLRGEMSLVGPRAPLPEEVAAYTNGQRRRLSVKPGITCLWQVSGRNRIDFEQWMQLDLKYIDSWSIWLDLKILAKTIPTVLLCRGAH